MTAEDLKSVITLFKHVVEQGDQPLIDFFARQGGNYLAGDILILNANLFPELLFMHLPERVLLSDWLAPDFPGAIISKKYMGYSWWENRDIIPS